MLATKRHLRIEGFQGNKTVFQTCVELDGLTEGDIRGLLRALAHKAADLSYGQVVRDYVQGGPKSANRGLTLEGSARGFAFGSVADLTFTACVMDGDDQP